MLKKLWFSIYKDYIILLMVFLDKNNKEYLHKIKNHYDKIVEGELELVKIFN